MRIENPSLVDEDAECGYVNQKLCNMPPNNYDRAVSVSITPDMSDLNSLVRPTWQDLEYYGYEANEFIGQCSFDNRPCWSE